MVNPTIVAMISGGVDSTYMLFKLLNETDYHIHAHHINIKNSIEKRWKKEKESVSQILTYCRNKYRDFEYSESSFELYNFCHTGSDAALQLFVGARVAQNMRATSVSVAIGCNKDEYESFQEIPQETGPLEGSNTAMLRAAIGYYMKQDRDRINDVPMFPIIEDTKYEIIKRLPKKLANLTWSCRTPNKGVECNKCHSCVARNKVENLIQLKENGNNRSVKLIPVPTLNRIVGINEALIYDSTTGNNLFLTVFYFEG